jgi:hypothetical protein
MFGNMCCACGCRHVPFALRSIKLVQVRSNNPFSFLLIAAYKMIDVSCDEKVGGWDYQMSKTNIIHHVSLSSTTLCCYLHCFHSVFVSLLVGPAIPLLVAIGVWFEWKHAWPN